MPAAAVRAESTGDAPDPATEQGSICKARQTRPRVGAAAAAGCPRRSSRSPGLRCPGPAPRTLPRPSGSGTGGSGHADRPCPSRVPGGHGRCWFYLPLTTVFRRLPVRRAKAERAALGARGPCRGAPASENHRRDCPARSG